MARNVVERKLTETKSGRIRFAVATEADDADIRQLLRENPMPGNISLCLEREPDYFADARLPGELKQTIVARADGRLACVGWCVFRERFVNGTPRQVGYLGGLRLDRFFGGRVDILRRGYEYFLDLQRARPAELYFTSIAADNIRARRFLEHGLPGLPRYAPLANFVTLLIAVSPRRRLKEADSPTVRFKRPPPPVVGYDAIAAFLDQHGQHQQLAPCWTSEALRSLTRLGLTDADFVTVRDGEGLVAHAALWDQRAFKQTVIRGYGPMLNFARPLLNAAARLLDRPNLPPVGEPVAHAFVSHLAVALDDAESLVTLVRAAQAHAKVKGIRLLTLGFDAHDPRLVTLRRHFRTREYRSRLYAVNWPGLPNAFELEGGLICPEVALL